MSPDASLINQSGLVALPGSAAPSNSTNPADIALVGATGSAVPVDLSYAANDALAFNHPSWIPNDRPPFPGENLPPELPANLYYQAANTPYGIRNFNIGANTSLVHRNMVPMGVGTPTAHRTTDTKTAMTELIARPLGEGLPADVDLLEPHAKAPPSDPSSTDNAHLLNQDQPGSDNPSSPGSAASSRGDRETQEDTSPTLLAALDDEPAERSPRFDEAAVDRMMADQIEADAARADVAVSQIVAEDAPETGAAAPSAVHALAASVAVAATVAMQQPRASERTTPDSWRSQMQVEGFASAGEGFGQSAAAGDDVGKVRKIDDVGRMLRLIRDRPFSMTTA
ncbi:MAG TPA: hypothetical protein PK867_20360 [Pirellulales bacterium]|nr:hypothetical protein [Pirellulales bacterium]